MHYNRLIIEFCKAIPSCQAFRAPVSFKGPWNHPRFPPLYGAPGCFIRLLITGTPRSAGYYKVKCPHKPLVPAHTYIHTHTRDVPGH